MVSGVSVLTFFFNRLLNRKDRKTMLSQELSHFLNLANCGFHPGASGGQQRAAKLARVVALEVSGLDDQAQRGLVEFIALVSFAPSTARDLLVGGWDDEE
jgi:hypothetical protein